MSIWRSRCPRTLPLVAVLAAAAGPSLHAATVTSTWVGSASANWSAPANWSPATAYPNNGNGGVSDYSVIIKSVTTPNNNPTADVSASIDSLTLNAGANLTINTGITVSLNTTTVINAGNITLNGNSTSGNSTLSLAANGTTFLTGGGTVSLTVGNYSRISGGTLVNVDNTIQGQGTIACTLINEATLYAVHNVATLWNGQIWGFPLELDAPVDNSNGTLTLADDGAISVHTTVTGGTLSTSSDSYLYGNGTLKNVTLTANSILNVQSGFIMPSFAGTLTNLGTITNSVGNLTFNNATLAGGGTVLLSKTANIVGSFTNFDNTIRGQGSITANTTNQSTIRAEGGTLSVYSLNNASGNISVAANATLYCNGTLSGGNISLDYTALPLGVGQLAGTGTLQNVTLTSGSTWTLVNASPTIAGTFTNRGTITFYQSASTAVLKFPPTGTTTLNGGGTISLSNATFTQITGNFTNLDNTIQGAAIISSNITNQSSIIASGGNLTLTGTVDNSNGIITVTANGTLLANATFTGGNISVMSGGQVGGNGTVTSTAFSGNATIIGFPQFNNITLANASTLTIPTSAAARLSGTFYNSGTLALLSNTPLFLATNGTTTLTGGGTVILSHTSIGTGNLTNLDNTIQGAGGIASNLTNYGAIIATGGNLSFTSFVTGTGNAIITPGAAITAYNFAQSSLQNDGAFTLNIAGTLGPITGNGTVSISSNAHLILAPNSPTSHQSDLTAPTLHALDLTNNKFIIDPVSKSTTFTKLKSEIAAGDIFSSALTPNTTLLLIDNAVANLTTFGGLPVTTNSLLLATELLGDANLDGKIDLSDLSTVLNNFGTTTSAWTSGNFDGAATIDLTDLSAVLNNFGLSTPSATTELPIADYQLPSIPSPEPTTLAPLALAAAALFTRKRRYPQS
ncbi:MAG TPA: PEP-CTERM sorting domain-containing protein [Phycisphaerae bacterium]|nr:PEP-CTERM sorting domain-containing protein [Phycisphaerae bacterium]